MSDRVRAAAAQIGQAAAKHDPAVFAQHWPTLAKFINESLAAATPGEPGESATATSAPDAELTDPIRRTLLNAWHDLKWYRGNAKEHPGKAGRTIEAIEAALRTDDLRAATRFGIPTPETVERVARWIKQRFYPRMAEWERLDDITRNDLLDDARAALRARGEGA